MLLYIRVSWLFYSTLLFIVSNGGNRPDFTVMGSYKHLIHETFSVITEFIQEVKKTFVQLLLNRAMYCNILLF